MTKICPYAFSRIKLFDEKGFVPCCTPWLNAKYVALKSNDTLWNGQQAQALRKSMYEGTFEFCHLDRCQQRLLTTNEIRNNQEIRDAHPLSDEVLDSIDRELTVLPQNPSVVTLNVDPRCNLACPSCRKTHILTVNSDQQFELKLSEKYLNSVSKTLKSLNIALDGEVFFSPWLKDLIRSLSHRQYPALQGVQILSNGLLFNNHMLTELLPGSEFISRVIISIDAGNAVTYKAVRGGSWEKLTKNLQWISELRRMGRFRYFGINFVVRKANYRSIQDFVELGRRLSVDHIEFGSFDLWKRSAITDYDTENVLDPKNKLYPEVLQLLGQYATDPQVKIEIPLVKSQYPAGNLSEDVRL